MFHNFSTRKNFDTNVKEFDAPPAPVLDMWREPDTVVEAIPVLSDPSRLNAKS